MSTQEQTTETAIPKKPFGFGDEAAMLRDSVRKLLTEKAPVEKLRATVAADHKEAYETEIQPARFDEAIWQEMTGLGLTAAFVPESASGAGFPLVAAAALAEELGRAALPSPLTQTLAATYVARAGNGMGAAPLLADIAQGTAVALAVFPEDGDWEPEHSGVKGTPGDDVIMLNGEACFVQDARKADTLIVAADTAAGPALFRVACDEAGVTIAPDQIVDLTRDQARVRFKDVAVPDQEYGVVARPGAAYEALAESVPARLVLAAADICGAAEWQLQTTVEYAKVREQFGRPIGFFQAVKHPLVNMMIDIDRARGLTYAAAAAVDAGDDRADELARMAKAAASDVASFCSDRSVQLHGGIGFTWECDVHLWFKRQRHSAAYLGDAMYHRRKLADLGGLL